jgi:hypothetical protein
LENSAGGKTRVDSQNIISGNTKGARDTSNKITGGDDVDAARLTSLVGVTASLRPGRELKIFVGL